MKNQIIECVPNFSEGNDPEVIRQITNAIESTDGVRLLNVDPGKATNRTVVTFAGSPEQVVEAAFRGIKKAAELIDMSKHQGEHPRMGATDVCPLIPVSGISMEETAKYARMLGERVGNELAIPVYLYEEAQPDPKRKNLSVIRSGEYEGLKNKIADPLWNPDFGPAEFNPRSGATVIGARDFLIAYNVNLNTKSVRRANSIAFDLREAGRILREGDPVTGTIVKDESGNEVRIPGKLKGVKAIGWYIEEYGIAQVSINITDIQKAPIHQVFEESCNSAEARGLRVTGSELVGLIPLKALTDAGKYFLEKQNVSTGVSETELVHIAIKSMGLDELGPFDPKQRVIEYILDKVSSNKLIKMPLDSFADETASDSPAPGGGSISAYVGVLGISLGTMVANLSANKRGWDDRCQEFSRWAEKGQVIKDNLLRLVDEDTLAFNRIMDGFSMPKNTDIEKNSRKQVIQEATKYAAEIPLKVMKTAFEAYPVIRTMADQGNPNSISDAGVGALCISTAITGAYLNVRINSTGIEDKSFVAEILKEADEIEQSSKKEAKEILELVFAKVS